MKVLHINHTDINGGAARAVYRLHRSLLGENVESRLRVVEKNCADWTVQCGSGVWEKAFNKIKPVLAQKFVGALTEGERAVLHSPALFSSPSLVKKINSSTADIVHLHWINSETLSISDISKIKKKTVWTFHDMWPFCGAEHVTEDNRWCEGYFPQNKPTYEARFDLNRWVWQRKIKHWDKRFSIVTPSTWMAECTRKSYIFKQWPVQTIPNAIDTDAWRPLDREFSRFVLGLPKDKSLIAFGSFGANSTRHKGFDLLKNALDSFKLIDIDLEIVIFGQNEPKNPVITKFPVHYTGHLHDDISMCLLYSAVDTIVIPSRIDNFPSAGIEAHSCGTPVVAFNTCGLSDIVQHKTTGFLAEPFDPEMLATGILWVLNELKKSNKLRKAARNRAVERWDSKIVARQYASFYEKVLYENQG